MSFVTYIEHTLRLREIQEIQGLGRLNIASNFWYIWKVSSLRFIVFSISEYFDINNKNMVGFPLLWEDWENPKTSPLIFYIDFFPNAVCKLWPFYLSNVF